ncbi:MAG TPA: DeoR/GlpR family DNA-binding transcription regulator [Chitinophaga sp.]|uniref:DeoR/GlpR family DNA-binding transcription regulator n=1 Tax=Chitinophaga sp. TaxID=1869181 RepID=UPI002DBE8F51|nr:DeoR/GlpR family DNA-binding transcription regulator [Chitinophaga sp.]HEU4551274.1 DeoR/GlpR family DNA-binding transcription regulator [Chitinophaga sp.]
MNITDRHQFILQQLQENGKVDIQELTDALQVSGVTIRKDLKLLEEKKLLFRTKGGGSTQNPYTIEKPINEKEFIKAEEKKKIAKAAFNLIGMNDSIIMGSGTTVFELAHILHPSKHLTVITPALKVALELCNRPNVNVLQIGGLIHPSSASAGGSFAERLLDDISCGVLFIGVDGIDPEFGLSITNLAEASLDTKMVQLAQTVVVMADSSKFDRRGIGRICSLEQVDYIITDNLVPPDTVKMVQDRGVKVIIA